MSFQEAKAATGWMNVVNLSFIDFVDLFVLTSKFIFTL